MVWIILLSTMKVIPHSLTAGASLCGIRSLIKFSTPVGALAYLVLYLRKSASDAIPKYISERTSYHGV
jgi:hypothetical protein